MASSPKPPLSGAASSESRLDDRNLRAWMLQYGPALRRYFLRRASNAADVDDLVQDVFLRLKARGAETSIENVEGYIFRTAATVLIRRRERVTWAWGRQEPIDEVEGLADELSPERILIGKQGLALVMRALEDLPPRAAQAFILYRFENLSQEAVARRMGVSLKAVEKFLRKALLQLVQNVGSRL